jgi:hypothetical protein
MANPLVIYNGLQEKDDGPVELKLAPGLGDSTNTGPLPSIRQGHTPPQILDSEETAPLTQGPTPLHPSLVFPLPQSNPNSYPSMAPAALTSAAAPHISSN